ncbi:MAG: hypothetical protein NT029_06980 [Armatimonadetes bacterium]|nr:hypothetical protein [Armatimonadota bacterium]
MHRKGIVCLLSIAALFVGGCAVRCDFSPDGRRLLVPTDAGLRMVATAGGSSTLIPESKGSLGGVWSPNGRRVAYNVQDGPNLGVWVHDVDQRRARRIVTAKAFPAAWRDDGALVAVLNLSGAGALEAYDALDGSLAFSYELPGKPEGVMDVGFVPGTNNLLALVSVDDESDLTLFEAGETVRLTSTGDVLGYRLMPDGHVRWVRRAKDPRFVLVSTYQQTLAQRFAGKLTQVERAAAINPGQARAPRKVVYAALSPDGSRIALLATVARPDAKGAPHEVAVVYCLTADGKASALLTAPDENAADAWAPTWSPDGRWVCITVESALGQRALLVSPDGKTRKLAAQVAPPKPAAPPAPSPRKKRS